MGGKNNAPPPPDYSGVAAASAESAKLSYQLGQEQLAWAREQYAKDSGMVKRVVDMAMETQERNNATAAKDRERYEKVYQPLENEFIRRGEQLRDSRYIESRAASAAGDVSQQFAQARENAMARLESYGIDPSQTRATALDYGTRTQEAAARASAANTSRLQTEGQANAMLGGAIDIGKGYPSAIAQQYGTGLAGGGQAVGSTLQNTQTGASTMGTGTQWQGLGNSAVGTWGNTLNMGYQNQMAQYKANQESSSGIGQLLGLGLGIGTKLATGGLFAEGGAVEEPGETVGPGVLPTWPAEHSGIPVPREASPSHGQAIDDIPATVEGREPARLNAGEFIVPEDTVRWFGEKFFQKTIEKGREEQGGAVAKPKVGVLPV